MAKLPEDEVFPNPTVRRVIFQIRFANLFFLESRVGDLQLEIMERFPKSDLRIQRTVVFAQGSENEVLQKAQDLAESNNVGKLWTFSSPLDLKVEVKQNSVTLVTEKHKSYQSGSDCFRNEIKFVLDKFHKVTQIPFVERIGLRYVDACPIPEFTTARFQEYYATSLPVERFSLETSSEMAFRTLVSRGANLRLRYQETIEQTQPSAKLILDFDAFAETVKWDQILSTADELHSIIRNEFEKTIREPVLTHMRNKPGGDQGCLM